MQWYFAGFQGAVGNPGNWELRWVGGGSISNWADPNYDGWTNDNNLVTGCDQDVNVPERALLNVSDDFHNDVNFWVTETTAAMNNLRHKYPSVRQIILQSVVGGPGGQQCTFNGSVVRASYNFPYINQAIQQMVGGSVVAGIAPTVRTCADYADNIGHLTDDAKGPIGVTIGSFYAASGSSGPTATPTSTRAATSTPVPTTGATATPVPTLGTGQTRTITFDDISNPNRPLSGQYPTGVINWGTNNWYVSGPFGSFRNNSVSFNGSGPTSETFAYVSAPMRLIQLDAYNGDPSAASTVTLSCNGTRATQVTLQPNQIQTISMGFMGVCNTITIGSSNGWRTNFDNLVVDNGAATPTPTATPISTRPPASTATPTPVATAQASSSFTVTFDNLSNPNRTLNGQYPNGAIDWGTNNWYLSGPFGAFSSNSVSFNGAGPTMSGFGLLTPRRLVQLDAYNGGSTASTVSLACPGMPNVQVVVQARQVQTISTHWSGTCSTVTIGSSNGWNTNFDNLFFDTPATSGSSSNTITFDDLSNPNRPLTGQYPGGVADWGSGAWYLSGPFGAFRTNSVSFNGAGPTSASVNLLQARRVVSIDVYNGGAAASTVSLNCAGQAPVSVSVAANQQLTLTTNWSGTCTSLTINSSNGWNTNFDNLVLQ